MTHQDLLRVKVPVEYSDKTWRHFQLQSKEKVRVLFFTWDGII